jgi:hypothetical protein
VAHTVQDVELYSKRVEVRRTGSGPSMIAAGSRSVSPPRAPASLLARVWHRGTALRGEGIIEASALALKVPWHSSRRWVDVV